ncbi:MAG: DUF1990 domain-containing protein [Saprospiraceae bacterium]|nr:DUF1990 domain-containing protein [Saprospiraceae bacterium]
MANLFQLALPNSKTLDTIIEQQKNAKLNYSKDNLSGFDFDKNQIYLGTGDNVWQAAKKAMTSWAMFPNGWTRIYYQNPIFTEGDIVVLCARVFGIWWLNASRIITVIDDDQHFGFAYGTLPHHVEKGEELFQVYRNEQGEVFYNLTAFSKPNFWPVRWTYPLSRRFQKRFVRDSLNNVKLSTSERINEPYLP